MSTTRCKPARYRLDSVALRERQAERRFISFWRLFAEIFDAPSLSSCNLANFQVEVPAAWQRSIENEKTKPMVNQAAPSLENLGVTMAMLEVALLERDREIGTLKLDVARYKRQAEDAQGRAAMLEVAIDRHFSHCEKDDAAIQRLIAGRNAALAQAAFIERRNPQIATLPAARGLAEAKKVSQHFGLLPIWLRLKQLLSR